MNEIEKLMFDAVRLYYSRDYQACKKMIIFVATHERAPTKLVWWKRFLIDFSNWEVEVVK